MNEENKGLVPADYQMALDAQLACNLSGIVYTFSKIMPRIWAEARKNGKGTDWVNRHPICRLFAEQIAFLSGAGTPMSGENDYSKAYNICTAEASKAKEAV